MKIKLEINYEKPGAQNARKKIEELKNYVDVVTKKPEIIIVMGGDGAMLNAARKYVDSGIPLLGINLGGLGFLTDISEERIAEAIKLLSQGRYHIEERLMMAAKTASGELKGLNDVVVYTKIPGRAVELSAWVEDEYLCRFIADGLIIATPTGSTAYSLACGGPIVFPATENILITPISAHTLSVRPIVVSSDKRVRVKIGKKGKGAWIISDGQEKLGLDIEEEVTLYCYPKRVRLVKLEGSKFTDTLRTKMRWGGREDA